MDKLKISDSSLDSVILLNDSEDISKTKKCKRKHKKSSKTHLEKSKNIISESHKDSNINISQQIQVENKEFQCVINLKTNVYKRESRCKERSTEKHRSRHRQRHSKVRRLETKNKENKSMKHNVEDRKCQNSGSFNKYHNKDRSVPVCNRRICRNKCDRIRDRSRRKRLFTKDLRMDEIQKKIDNKGRRHKSKDKIKQEEQKVVKKHHKKVSSFSNATKTQYKQSESRILLSPISSSPFEEDLNENISYEEISSASLNVTDVVKKSSSHKHHHHKHPKNCKHRQHKHRKKMHERKLDTLIKRTKERERKQVEKSRSWLTSTPISQELSSGDFPMTCSDLEDSIHSASTMVLHSQTPCALLEEKKSLNTSCETLRLNNYQPYSPSSPINEVYMPNEEINGKDEEIDYQWHIQKPFSTYFEENRMKIEAYSPTHDPEITPKLYHFSDVKQEIDIKSDPLFSSELSPIYNEGDSKLILDNKFCKIEHVKTEPMSI